ncbi:MAG: hypothetical protein JSW36_12195 [Burkholderiales bacterium]|nr:MAG: hypothetical protein JSW36_12195 [Burkholderiales bacterium]
MRQPIVLSLALALSAGVGSAAAKLPPPSDEAKAKSADAAAKAAWGGKVANFQLCKSMDRVAARYIAEAKSAGKTVTPVETQPCVDPGPYTEGGAAPAAPAAPAPAKKS